MSKRNIFLFLLVWSIGAQAQSGQRTLVKKMTYPKGAELVAEIRPVLYSTTMVMVHDVVDPPAASRYYSYMMLAAYDLVWKHDHTMVSPDAIARNFPVDTMGVSGDYRIAAVYAILEAGRQMMPSGYLLEKEEKKFLERLGKLRFSQSTIDRSVATAKAEVKKVIAFSRGDRYNLLSTKLRYTPLKKDSTWYPTPPSYMEAVEPHWRIIRPMMIDSSSEFIPPSLTSFSKDTSSELYRLAMEVYTISKDTGAKSLYERTIAGFWDCNPFAITTSGHMMIGLKKMSPGGHWMDITGNAAAVAGLNFNKTVEAETLVAVTLMDAFISCWDEKYRSNRIRPETYIDRYIDPRWQPYLQTPPFPEYTSGHSVISTAAAEVLTYLFGDSIDYTDNAEELFEIRPRTFHSFREAAEEAAISRLYGGIHYRDAVINGQIEGRALGAFVVDRLKTAGVKPLR